MTAVPSEIGADGANFSEILPTICGAIETVYVDAPTQGGLGERVVILMFSSIMFGTKDACMHSKQYPDHLVSVTYQHAATHSVVAFCKVWRLSQ